MSGLLTVFYGCMFSGKTSALIDFLSQSGLKRNEFIVFKPNIDNRSSNVTIKTHDGRTHDCLSIDTNEELSQHIQPFTKLIAIDEAQFFNKMMMVEIKRLLNKGIHVVASGLDKDYLARPFGLMPLLIEHANHKTELFAKCDCSAIANFTYRKENNKVLILIGDNNYYQAKCSNCYYQLTANNS